LQNHRSNYTRHGHDLRFIVYSFCVFIDGRT
jgi:hypothetical protein